LNYIVEIKAFYDLVYAKQLSTGQIALWHALMYLNNKCAWAEWFSAPNITLELQTGLSRQGIQKARNALKQYGVIDFRSNGTKATSYKMVTMSNNFRVGCQDSFQDGCQDGCQDSFQVGSTLNKLNQTKLNETKRERETPREKRPRTKFIPPTVDEVRAYCQERNNGIDPEAFVAHYTANGWKVGKADMKDWKSAVITWEKRRREYGAAAHRGNNHTARTQGDSKPAPKLGTVL
jgi:hypothetical protein